MLVDLWRIKCVCEDILIDFIIFFEVMKTGKWKTLPYPEIFTE